MIAVAEVAATAEDRRVDLILQLTRMRQEMDARLQAWMADRPSTPPLIVVDSRLEREIDERVKRARPLTPAEIAELPAPPRVQFSFSSPDPVQEAAHLRIELGFCRFNRACRDGSAGLQRRYFHARLKQHQLVLVITRVGRDMRQCRERGWFDCEPGEKSTLKARLGASMTALRVRLMAARRAAEDARDSLKAERERAAKAAACTSLSGHLRL